MESAKFFRIVEGNALRVHCNKIANLIAYTRFDGAGFWVINAKKKKHLLAYTILNGNTVKAF